MLIIPFINLLIKYCLCFQSKKARGTFYNTSQEALQEVTQNLSITPHIQQQLVFWWLCSTGFLLKPTKRKKEKPPVRSGLDLRTKQGLKVDGFHLLPKVLSSKMTPPSSTILTCPISSPCLGSYWDLSTGMGQL